MWIITSYVDNHLSWAWRTFVVSFGCEVSDIFMYIYLVFPLLSFPMCWQARAIMSTLAGKSFVAGLGRENSKSSCW